MHQKLDGVHGKGDGDKKRKYFFGRSRTVLHELKYFTVTEAVSYYQVTVFYVNDNNVKL